MGVIRIVGPGKTRRYPYLVCKKNVSHLKKHTGIHTSYIFLEERQGGFIRAGPFIRIDMVNMMLLLPAPEK